MVAVFSSRLTELRRSSRLIAIPNRIITLIVCGVTFVLNTHAELRNSINTRDYTFTDMIIRYATDHLKIKRLRSRNCDNETALAHSDIE